MVTAAAAARGGRRRLRKIARLTAIVASGVLVAVVAPLAPAQPSTAGLETAVLLHSEERLSDNAAVTFARIREAGASSVRLFLYWSAVAPAGTTKPAGFISTDPADPHYRWSALDQEIRLAVQNGLEPIVAIYAAPRWAEGGGGVRPGIDRPDPRELGDFARAAATRYSGVFLDLPRVRRWQVWNEPNLHIDLFPQFEGNQPASPQLYRSLVNAMAEGVKSVRADNLVIAGGTAPFYDNGITHLHWGPLGFMRELFCLDKALKRKCVAPLRFDVWSHHPYTSGGPTRRAVLEDDASLGDLPDVKRVLDAGVAAGNVEAANGVRFWVTEFSWDSAPPDPLAVPHPLLTRWTAEAFYRMWTHGVQLVTWLSFRDMPLTTLVQSGLYFRGSTIAGDTPKPHLQAFRFPFVAYPTVEGVRVWGRTPHGRQATVLVQQLFRGGWTDLGAIESDENGIVKGRLVGRALGDVRARTVDLGELSAPFSPRLEPDRTYHPFGGPQLEPDRPPLPVATPTIPARPGTPIAGAPAAGGTSFVPARPAR
jgi:hypothetical protein